MSEIWAQIDGYEGFYEVSSFGRVRSVERVVRHRHGLATMKSRVLKQSISKAGYAYVCLSKECRGKSCLVHRLVARAFLPACDKPEVNHKDFNKSNNCVDNLEWASRSENHIHAMSAGRFDAEINPSARRKLTPEKVRDIRQLRLTGVSVKDIASKYNLHTDTVYGVLSLKVWKSVTLGTC